MTPKAYFAQHSVFRFDEFRAAHRERGERSPQTTRAVLKQHVAAGHLINIRRGLYARVPEGENSVRYRVDPFLIAARIASLNSGILLNPLAIVIHQCLRCCRKTGFRIRIDHLEKSAPACRDGIRVMRQDGLRRIEYEYPVLDLHIRPIRHHHEP